MAAYGRARPAPPPPRVQVGRPRRPMCGKLLSATVSSFHSTPRVTICMARHETRADAREHARTRLPCPSGAREAAHICPIDRRSTWNSGSTTCGSHGGIPSIRAYAAHTTRTRFSGDHGAERARWLVGCVGWVHGGQRPRAERFSAPQRAPGAAGQAWEDYDGGVQ